MARRPRLFRYRFIGMPDKAQHQRIHIPQPADRLASIRGDTIDRDFLSESPWWFVLHRRGVRRPTVGQDPKEARAVSRSTVPGTLPERILYMALIHLRMVPNVDFDFQSSQQGGRLELGGIVADFLFPHQRIIIQVQGPTHDKYIREVKDEEQRQILEEMGYTIYEITDKEIYDYNRMWEILRRIFNLGTSGGAGTAFDVAANETESETSEQLDDLYGDMEDLQMEVESVF